MLGARSCARCCLSLIAVLCAACVYVRGFAVSLSLSSFPCCALFEAGGILEAEAFFVLACSAPDFDSEEGRKHEGLIPQTLWA
jgi:hypothetical protein